MSFFVRFPAICFLALVIASCVTNDSSSSSDKKDKGIQWFEGSVDEAFELASERKVPVFLYWGATWCPPCNELKDQVFSKPAAARLVKSSVPVYIDGDSESAQKWADKFAVTGYPTVLLLDQNKMELMRVSESLSLREFTLAYQSAISLKHPFKKLISKAAKGQASTAEWRSLAFFSWYDAKGVDLLSSRVLSQRLSLAQKIPGQLKYEKSLLAASVLSAGSDARQKKKVGTNEIVREIKNQGRSLLDVVFTDYSTQKACRSFIIYRMKSTLSYLFDNDPSQMTLWKGRWLRVAQTLRRDPSLSIDTRLWTVNPEIQSHELSDPNGKKAVPRSLKDLVRKEVDKANRTAQSEYQRAAVVSGAAHLLKRVGLVAESRALLKKEIDRTQSPWYYQGAIASLEEKLGHKKAALYWSTQARKSVKGRASRLQWTVSDLLRTFRLNQNILDDRMKFLIHELYSLATSLPDGFSGRNRYRMNAVSDVLKKSKNFEQIKSYLRPIKKKCSDSDQKQRCISHFATYLL